MSRLQSLKLFINQRLSAAVEEVIGRLETAITEYEEELQSRQRRLLDPAARPEDARQAAGRCSETDVLQQLVIKQEVQEDPECPHIKEENQDFWTGEEVRGQLQGLHEDDITKLPAVHVHVKSEEEEKSQTSQLLQRQTEETGEAEPPAGSSAGGEDYGGPEPDRILVSDLKCLSGPDKTSPSSEAETEDSSDDWNEIRKPQTDLHTVKNKVPGDDTGRNTGNKSFSCSRCGKRFGQKHHLQTHMRCHTGEKPFSCSLCGKRFTQKGNLTQHLTVHTREKPCSCPVCGERFSQKGNLTQHMTVHTREKLCW